MLLEISARAQLEITQIFEFGIEKFGEKQAFLYSNEMLDLFDLILLNPKMARVRTEYRRQVRMISYGSHAVFYRTTRSKVKILRIIHGRQSWPKTV